MTGHIVLGAEGAAAIDEQLTTDNFQQGEAIFDRGFTETATDAKITIVITPHRIAATHAEGFIGGQRADVGAGGGLESEGLLAIFGFAGFGTTALVELEPFHRDVVGEAGPQSIEAGGIGAYGDELFGAETEKVALGGITGIIQSIHCRRQTHTHQLVMIGAVVADADHRINWHLAAIIIEVIGNNAIGLD